MSRLLRESLIPLFCGFLVLAGLAQARAAASAMVWSHEGHALLRCAPSGGAQDPPPARHHEDCAAHCLAVSVALVPVAPRIAMRLAIPALRASLPRLAQGPRVNPHLPWSRGPPDAAAMPCAPSRF